MMTSQVTSTADCLHSKEQENNEWRESKKKDAGVYLNNYLKGWESASTYFDQLNKDTDKKIVAESERLAGGMQSPSEVISTVTSLLKEVEESGILSDHQSTLVAASSSSSNSSPGYGMAVRMYQEMSSRMEPAAKVTSLV
eukprot:GHVH01010853.1.p1 GENE.GHVH01010853.1~~GHVH01010853.1.p1  ORF type:complete len:140 (+),score=23.84 GHVH01010853.1:71-490(+)